MKVGDRVRFTDTSTNTILLGVLVWFHKEYDMFYISPEGVVIEAKMFNVWDIETDCNRSFSLEEKYVVYTPDF